MIALILAAAVPMLLPEPSITLADAKRVLAAARADAAERKVSATIVVIDQYGELVLAQTAADADGSSLNTALLKARSIINYGSGTLMYDQPGASEVSPPTSSGTRRVNAGGAPLMSKGKMVGAIGDAGAAADSVAKAGSAVLK